MSVQLVLLLGAAFCFHVFSSTLDTKEQWARVSKEEWYRSPSVNVFDLIQKNNEFAFNFYRSLVSQNPGPNIIFSPLSISISMGFLALGARGRTKTEILEGLSFNLTETPEADIHQGFQLLLQILRRPGVSLQVNISTDVFMDGQLELKKNFLLGAWALYSAEVISTDFSDLTSTEDFINDYVEKKTKGRIQDMVHDLDEDTRMVLVNSIFFKGKWKVPFNIDNTLMSDFYMNMGRKMRIPMMRADYLRVPYFQDRMLHCTVVQLPYMNSSASILLILPKLGRMPLLELSLQLDKFYHWRDSLKMRKVALFLPKFLISWDYDLEQVLPDMGIVNIFSQQSDLSGLSTTTKNLSLSKMVHKAVLGVTEEGTEAATTTRRPIIHISGKPKVVRFNRPFLVAIISEETQGILLLGKVTNPQRV